MHASPNKTPALAQEWAVWSETTWDLSYLGSNEISNTKSNEINNYNIAELPLSDFGMHDDHHQLDDQGAPMIKACPPQG